MKKLLGIVALVSVLLTSGPLPASAAVTPGASCQFERQMAKSGSKSYACYFVNNNLVWSQPLVAETSKTFCPKATGALGTINKYSTCTVHLAAKNELLGLLKAAPALVAPVKVIADPDISAAWLAVEKNRVTDAYRFWSPHFKPSEFTELYWLMKPAQKLEWANSVFLPIQGNFNGGAPIQQLDPNNCQAAATSDYGKPGEHVYLTNTCAGELGVDKAFKIVHEYTHMVQYSMHMPQNAPIWVTEGGADYYGTILGNAKISNAMLNTHYKMFTVWIPDLSSWTKERFVSEMAKLESPNGSGHYAYYLGGVLTEFLVGLYGHDKYVSFMKSYEAAPDTRITPDRVAPGFFAEQFSKVYGLTPAEFYNKAYPYVKEIAKRYESLK